jgi:CRISPR/Cas system-associated protein Cas5 (RAMP superfamily)
MSLPPERFVSREHWELSPIIVVATPFVMTINLRRAFPLPPPSAALSALAATIL